MALVVENGIFEHMLGKGSEDHIGYFQGSPIITNRGPEQVGEFSGVAHFLQVQIVSHQIQFLTDRHGVLLEIIEVIPDQSAECGEIAQGRFPLSGGNEKLNGIDGVKEEVRIHLGSERAHFESQQFLLDIQQVTLFFPGGPFRADLADFYRVDRRDCLQDLQVLPGEEVFLGVLAINYSEYFSVNDYRYGYFRKPPFVVYDIPLIQRGVVDQFGPAVFGSRARDPLSDGDEYGIGDFELLWVFRTVSRFLNKQIIGFIYEIDYTVFKSKL